MESETKKVQIEEMAMCQVDISKFQSVMDDAVLIALTKVVNDDRFTNSLKRKVEAYWGEVVEKIVDDAVMNEDWLRKQVNEQLDVVVRERLAKAIEKLVPELRRSAK